MAATNKHQQLILLEPERAEQLQALSDRTRIPKQVLLREAVDYLLAIYGHPYVSPRLDMWRNSMMQCECLMSQARHVALPDNVDRACAETSVRIASVLEDWGAGRENRPSYDRNPPTGANSHRAKKGSGARKAASGSPDG
ncbi:MAG TPA: ribbon-helix-helix domain-containing protein [Steroidobacteraceae bacterium]|jgi:hypothetical protein